MGDNCYMIFLQATTKVTNTTSSALRTVLSTIARVFDPLGILAPLCNDNAKFLLESYGTNSSQYEQAILELVRRYGNPKYVVSAFNRELEKFDILIISEPWGFIRYAAFLRKLIHNL